MPYKPLNQFNSRDLAAALKAGSLALEAGAFSHVIEGRGSKLVEFMQDVYRDYPVSLYPEDVTDNIVRVRAPNFIRRFIRPQILPDPGFEFPSVPMPASMSPLVLEMGLNLSVALKTMRFVSFHAGVVDGPDGAIIMSAESGGGKSTLTAALVEQGFRLLSDEFALLGLDEPTLNAYPRPISLKNESIDVVRGLAGEDWISQTVEGSPKGDIAYRRPRASDIADAHKTAKPKLILFPFFEEGLSPLAERLNPAEAIMRLIPASTNYSMLGEPAYRSLLQLVLDAPAYEVSYGTLEDSLKLVEDLYAEAGGNQ